MLTRRMITRGVRRQNKARREFLREPRDGLIVFGNACNNVANARKFFVGLATVLQTPKSFLWDLQQCCKRQKVFRETCNSVANAKKFFVGLATVLQTPESFSWDLQQCCKRRKVFRAICSVPAKTKKFLGAFAAFLQTPESFSRHLQRRCKRQKVFRGICSIPANTRKFFEALAAFLQTPKSFSCHLQRCCKHFQKHCAAFSALSKTFFRDTDPHSFAELAFGMCFVQIFCIVRSMYAHCKGAQIDIPSIFAPNKRDFT